MKIKLRNQHEIEIWSKDILSGLNQIQNTINTLNLDQVQYEAFLMTSFYIGKNK